MQNILKNGATSALIGLTAFVSPAWAERAIRLSIPVRVDGDLSKVTDGIWLYCLSYVWDDSAYQAEWTAQISAPGATFAPNADDGTFLTTFEFVPSELGADIHTRFEGTYTIDINCKLQRGAVIPAEQLKPGDIERTSRSDKSGYPSAPAGPGSCGNIFATVLMPDYRMQLPPKLEACL
ncbi:hypothetical protein J7382_11660 [Shimia sp. R11_0]|uniref:hypothetical protein n=1 Tax=Shimia sp. R11_0 TaxID=2821096 RepID=UPI001ADC90FF|nr:hypothetical protein [Shimia sp. R11_0]MBO9478192.1 hypothetical protein [Shimia sp. R11_0]